MLIFFYSDHYSPVYLTDDAGTVYLIHIFNFSQWRF
jgi:hypothetical protein